MCPKIVETDFRKGGGWDIEFKMLGYMPEWNWADKGVSPVVSMLAEDSDANFAAVRDENLVLANAGVSRTEISVKCGTDEAPYIVLALRKSNRGADQREPKDFQTETLSLISTG